MKNFSLLIAVVLLQINLFAQTADSVSMLPGTTLDVYYNLTTGHKDTVRNNNWHIAFAVRKAQPPLKTMQAATIRINDGRSVELYKSNTSISSWNTFDTSGWNAWPQMFNSDSTWDIGAFNQNRNLSNPFDYGWGQYNMTSKDVVGANIWLVAMVTSPIPGAPKTLKKLAVHKIAYDTMWVVTYSNIDGTDSNTVTIKKSDYNNKLFAYLNLNTHVVLDREPALNTWDIVFTRYKSLVTMFGQTLMYPVMGVLHNPSAVAFKYFGANAQTLIPDSTLAYKPNINTIGWDWKQITTSPGAWPIEDSTSFVVKVSAIDYHKIYFTEYYADASIQYIKFNKTYYNISSGSNELNANFKSVNVFPNPATDILHIDIQFEKPVTAVKISILDLTGRELENVSFNQVNDQLSHTFQTSNLRSGIYFVTLESEGMKTSKKVVIN